MATGAELRETARGQKGHVMLALSIDFEVKLREIAEDDAREYCDGNIQIRIPEPDDLFALAEQRATWLGLDRSHDNVKPLLFASAQQYAAELDARLRDRLNDAIGYLDELPDRLRGEYDAWFEAWRKEEKE